MDGSLAGVEALVLVGSFDTLEVIGDPEAEAPSVSGPHEAEREGARLVIRGIEPPNGICSAVDVAAVGNLGGTRVELRVASGHREAVVVRVPAGMAVSGTLGAATVSVRNLEAPLQLGASAGTVRVVDCRGPVGVSVQTGTISLSGAPGGRSRVTARTGTVQVSLPHRADIEVGARCQTGSILVSGPTGGDSSPLPSPLQPALGDRRHFTLGAGTNALEIQVGTGTIQLLVT